MGQGRWLDDAYTGSAPLTPAGRRMARWMKWTWPLMLAACFVATIYIGQAGWVVGMGAWFASFVPAYMLDERARKEAARQAERRRTAEKAQFEAEKRAWQWQQIQEKRGRPRGA